MTHDEILNMPAGREMDALICEFMKDVPEEIWGHKSNDGDGWYDIIGSKSYAEDVFQRRTHLHDKAHVDVLLKYKKYSQDISEAWIVLEKMRLSCIHDDFEPEFIQICAFPNRASMTSFYCAKMWAHHDGDIPLIEVMAETAPLAICRAGLITALLALDIAPQKSDNESA